MAGNKENITPTGTLFHVESGGGTPPSQGGGYVRGLFDAIEEPKVIIDEGLVNQWLKELKPPFTLDDFLKTGSTLYEIACMLLFSSIFKWPLNDNESLKVFLKNKDLLKKADYESLVTLNENKNRILFDRRDLFLIGKSVLTDKLFGDFISLLVEYLNNENVKINVCEFVILFLLFKNNHAEGGNNSIFESFKSMKETFFGFKGVDFESKELKKKLCALTKGKKYKIFDLKNIEFTYKYFVERFDKSKCPFDDYLDFWSKIDAGKIEKINENYENIMSLISENFGIKGKALLSVVNYDIELNKLEQFIQLFKDVEFLVNQGVKPSDLRLSSLNELVKVLGRGRDDQLLFISVRTSKLSDDKISSSRKSLREEISSIEAKYHGGKPYKSIEPELTLEEQGMVASLIEENTEQQKLIKDYEALIEGCRSNIAANLKTIEGVKKNSPGVRSRVVENRNKVEEETRKKCDIYFDSGVDISNYELIFKEYVDIVFNPKYGDKYLSRIPSQIINSVDFFDKVFEISFPKNYISFPKNYYRIVRLFKYLSGDVLDYAFNRMSQSGYLNIMINVCLSDSGLYSYILSKYGEMKAVNGVKLLPHLGKIPFDSDDDRKSFIDSITNEFGYFCLIPYMIKIPRLRGLDSGISTEKYKERCKENLLYGNKSIESVYTYGSGKIDGKISDSEQKFLLQANILDSENFDFSLVTDPDANSHRDIENFDFGEVFGGGYLKKDDLDAAIYVFGYSKRYGDFYLKFYPIIENIIKIYYPGYDVVFGDPHYSWD